MPLEPPDLPELIHLPLESLLDSGELTLEGVIVEEVGSAPVNARQIRITESELRGVSLGAQDVPGAQLRDVVLHDCDLSNLDAREGSMRRVQVRGSRLVGFSVAGCEVRDLSVSDCTLRLSSFAFAKLRDVVFERVDLAEASFMEAQLEGVHFIDCELTGVDFRKATTKGCTIRGASLDGVTGVESLKGSRCRGSTWSPRPLRSRLRLGSRSSPNRRRAQAAQRRGLGAPSKMPGA